MINLLKLSLPRGFRPGAPEFALSSSKDLALKIWVHPRHHLTRGLLLLTLLSPFPSSQAQAGGGGAAGAGGGTGATGPAAAAAHGAPATATPAQSAAATYAAGATPGADPRTPVPSKPGALTLAQVLDLARTKNLTLLAAEQNLRSVRAQELQAATRANPFLTLYGQNITLPQQGGENPSNYSVQISRLFERGQKRRFRIEDARATTAQTEAQLADTTRQTLLTVRQAFTRMLIAKQALALSTLSLKDFQHEVEISRDRYLAGDLGKLDYERLDLQLGSFESDESSNLVLVRQASDQLQTLIGIATPTPDFDIAGPVVPPLVAKGREALIALALSSRPDLQATGFALAAAEANARLAIANGTSDPTLEAEYDRTGIDNSFGVSVNVPLRLFDRNQGNKETARYLARAAALTQAATRNQVVSDVDQAWIGYTEARRLSDRFGQHYLDESKDVLSIAQFAFEHGGIALIDYLDALREARTATSDALNAYQQTWLAIHQLNAATATELLP
jgi:cobalt-zinc-cadmium efflux system outer membrane protein